MKEGRLLDSQKTRINELIAGQGLDPGRFQWVGVESVLRDNFVIDKIKGPDDFPFFFKFDRDEEGKYWAIYSPGLDERESKRMAYEWNNFQFVRDWLSAVIREMAPLKLQLSDSLRDEQEEYGLFTKKVFNRHIVTRAAASDESGEPLALLLIDLDHLGEINKKYLHAGGDQALKLVTESLKQITGTKGLCYRFGGDEFTTLLPNYSAEEAAALGERIRKQIEASTVGDEQFHITVSIGVASQPTHAKSADELLRRAGAAVYEAKVFRNRVCISGEAGPSTDSLNEGESYPKEELREKASVADSGRGEEATSKEIGIEE
jgi:diguanylate cyclase (GGDEF)-like protein